MEEILPESIIYPTEGEPTLAQILYWKLRRKQDGPSGLEIYHTCPACGNDRAIWKRQEWAVCFECELAFDVLECWFYDLTEEE